jgi:hypothetical protein
MKVGKKMSWGLILIAAMGLVVTGCSSEKLKNQAKEAAAKYWQDKAYPGKSYDVQVIDAQKGPDGTWQVKGIVDGENRVGSFNPSTETFSEGYYALAHERDRKIAELEQESKYWKEKADSLEKENYKLKVQLDLLTGHKAPAEADSKSDTKSE